MIRVDITEVVDSDFDFLHSQVLIVTFNLDRLA